MHEEVRTGTTTSALAESLPAEASAQEEKSGHETRQLGSGKVGGNRCQENRHPRLRALIRRHGGKVQGG